MPSQVPACAGDAACVCDTCRWRRLAAHRRGLLAYARRRTATEMDAEDVVAEALRRAYEKHDLLLDRALPWLYAVVHNLCVSTADPPSHRRKRRQYAAMHGGPSPSHEERVCEVAHAAWVARSLDALPEAQRRAILLKAEGYDVGEIADRLGVPYKAAESLLSRARQVLRRRIAAAAATLTAWVWAGRRSTATLGVSVAVAAGALLCAPGLTSRPDIGAGDIAGGPPAAGAVGASPTPAPATRKARSTGVGRQVLEVRPGPTAPAHALPAPAVSAGAQLGPVRVDDVRTGTQDDDETFAESLQECLDGITLTPGYIGCGASPSPSPPAPGRA